MMVMVKMVETEKGPIRTKSKLNREQFLKQKTEGQNSRKIFKKCNKISKILNKKQLFL